MSAWLFAAVKNGAEVRDGCRVNGASQGTTVQRGPGDLEDRAILPLLLAPSHIHPPSEVLHPDPDSSLVFTHIQQQTMWKK